MYNYAQVARTVCVLIAIGIQSLHAQSAEPWTTVASTGTVDEADAPFVIYNGAAAQVISSAPLPYTVNLTYSVVAVDGLISTLPGKYIKARFTDNGGAARVIVSLREYDILSGILRTRLTFDSNEASPADSSQLVTKKFCTATDTAWNFDFSTKLYYVEAQVVRSTSGGTPALFAIQVGKTGC